MALPRILGALCCSQERLNAGRGDLGPRKTETHALKDPERNPSGRLTAGFLQKAPRRCLFPSWLASLLEPEELEFRFGMSPEAKQAVYSEVSLVFSFSPVALLHRSFLPAPK